jgi:hypothetical protein
MNSLPLLVCQVNNQCKPACELHRRLDYPPLTFKVVFNSTQNHLMHKCVSDIQVEFEEMQGSFNQVQVNSNIKKKTD